MEIERACVERISEVMEAAAVGVPAPGGGPDRLVLFLVLQPGAQPGNSTARLQKDCQAAIRQHLNPLFRLQQVGAHVRAMPGAGMRSQCTCSTPCALHERLAGGAMVSVGTEFRTAQHTLSPRKRYACVLEHLD